MKYNDHVYILKQNKTTSDNLGIKNKKASLTSKATLICLTIILTHLPCLSGESLFLF